MSSAGRYTSWCFTLNNYNEEEQSQLRLAFATHCRYWIYGREVAPGTGTPHLQGYFRLKVRARLETVKNRFNSRAHFEVSRGSGGQNREYCSKSGDFDEGGDLPATNVEARASSRSDSARAFDGALIESRRTGMVQFAAEYPGEFFYSGSNLLRNWFLLQFPRERPDIQVSWYYGLPGTGKSRSAHEELPDAFVKEPRTKWWNGYMLEESVILDDFGPGGIDINHLLRWFDRYKCWVESKGGMLPLYATRFIVTSNFRPEEIFKWGDELNPQLPALMRRVSLRLFE